MRWSARDLEGTEVEKWAEIIVTEIANVEVPAHLVFVIKRGKFVTDLRQIP